MIELLFLVGGLATGVLAGLWSAHHLPARWRASTASEPRPEPPWVFDPISLDMWKRGNRTGLDDVLPGGYFRGVALLAPEPPPPVDVQALSPPKART